MAARDPGEIDDSTQDALFALRDMIRDIDFAVVLLQQQVRSLAAEQIKLDKKLKKVKRRK